MRTCPSLLKMLPIMVLILITVGICLGISACIVVPVMLALFALDDAIGEIGGHDTTSLRWKTTVTVVISGIGLLLLAILGQLWLPLVVLPITVVAFMLWVVWT